jgi:hypothetical protein
MSGKDSVLIKIVFRYIPSYLLTEENWKAKFHLSDDRAPERLGLFSSVGSGAAQLEC